MLDLDLFRRVEQFLFCEARLLDEGEFDAWIELFTEDARYSIPGRETRQKRGNSVLGADALPLVDDDKMFLKARVARLHSGFAHAEEPESRTRRFINNIEIGEGNLSDGLEVRSNILVFQSRLERTEKFYVGKRIDHLVEVDKDLKLRKRVVVLDHVLLPRSISIFL